jgi:hypothetical protein
MFVHLCYWNYSGDGGPQILSLEGSMLARRAVLVAGWPRFACRVIAGGVSLSADEANVDSVRCHLRFMFI